MKKGSATLYVLIGVIVFLSIITYVFSKTTNLEVDLISYFSKIKEEYENDVKEDSKDLIYDKLYDDANSAGVLYIPSEE